MTAGYVAGPTVASLKIDKAAAVAAKDRTDELLTALGSVGAEVKSLRDVMLLDVHLVSDEKGNPLKAIKKGSK